MRTWVISTGRQMKKVALVFVLAVLLPSLVLAWLAVRSLRDQQFLLERQQSLLDQRVTDSLAQNISDFLAQRQQEFGAQVESLAADKDTREVAAEFDDQLRSHWPLAEVGFCVTLSGKILSPSPNARPAAQMFYFDNKDFLGNREAVEVYRSQNFATATGSTFNRANANQQSSINGLGGGGGAGGQGQLQNQPQQTLALAPSAELPAQEKMESDGAAKKLPQDKMKLDQPQVATASGAISGPSEVDLLHSNTSTVVASDSFAFNTPQQNSLNYKQQTRKVSPQSTAYDAVKDSAGDAQNNLSKVIPAEAGFAQLVGDGTDGMLARFLQNKLELMFWHRLNREPGLIFGAQLNLNRVVDGLRGLVQPEPALQNEICLALLDDNAKPVAISRAGFQANWKRPFVATEIGEALPHWEVAAYLANPARLTQAAHTAKLTLGLLIGVLVLAIGIGSWLIVRSLSAELKLARQKCQRKVSLNAERVCAGNLVASICVRMRNLRIKLTASPSCPPIKCGMRNVECGI
jgi:hypothetical protein